MPSLRLFIAVELPPDVCEALGALQKRLQPLDRNRAVRWTAIESIHLTLKFLGDTPSDRTSAILAAMQEAAKGHQAFNLMIYNVGCFPNFRKPRIVWAGIQGNLDTLKSLRDAVERTVSPLGYPTEAREFTPHLTIGRAKQDARSDALSALGEQIGKTDVGKLAAWRVESFSLMQSDLKPSGAVYTQVGEIKL